MAHLGKLYPVHFRRDWSTQLRSYRSAFARRYVLLFDDSAGTIGSHVDDARPLFVAVDERTRDVPRWEVAPTNINGRIVTGFIECTQVNIQGEMEWRCEMFDSVQGSLVRATGGYAVNRRYRMMAARWDPAYFPHPSLWSSSPGNFWNLAALKWDGNPVD